MATQDALASINRTVERMDARFAESERRWEERDVEWRAFVERGERRWEQRDAEFKQLFVNNAEITQRMIEAIHGLEARIDDNRDQLRANTDATWHLVEVLGGERPHD